MSHEQPPQQAADKSASDDAGHGPVETVTAADHVTCTRAMPLHDLVAGQTAVIDRLELSEQDDARLLRLGLTPGRRITLIRSGPRPIVATAGARIALDRALALGVHVVVGNQQAPCQEK